MLHPDRLLPADPGVRGLAHRLYEHVRGLPIVSPHGHVPAATLADDEPITRPARELVTLDHYLLRMLYSQGVPLESLGVRPLDGASAATDDRSVWRTFAEHYHLFRGTPSKLWLDHTLGQTLQIETPLTAKTADEVYDRMLDRLAAADYRPRRLFERSGIEFLATTDGAVDRLDAHRALRRSGWAGRVVPTFRPDDVADPEAPGFTVDLGRLGELTGEDTASWSGYLAGIRARRNQFRQLGATATDHGPPSALTADLSAHDAEALFGRIVTGAGRPGEAELFRAQMLTEMAAMSLDDGLVMQLHTGSWRGHNPVITRRFGADMGADIPKPAEYVSALKPLLDRFGNETRLTVVVYTLDESTYSRELAPLAGHYPALRLGPPWWFYDSPEGIRRFRSRVTETAGFANTVGFNDDARSLLTVPARHDMARRMDAGYLAGLVAEHRLDEPDAFDLARDLAYNLARRAFRIEP